LYPRVWWLGKITHRRESHRGGDDEAFGIAPPMMNMQAFGIAPRMMNAVCRENVNRRREPAIERKL